METDNEYNKTHQMTRDEVVIVNDHRALIRSQFKNLPTFVQKAIRPPKQVPDYGKNVNWMHNKLKLIVKLPGGEEG